MGREISQKSLVLIFIRITLKVKKGFCKKGSNIIKDYSIFFLKQGSVLVFIETGQATFEEGGGGVVVYTAEEGAVPDCFEITSSDIAVA